MHAIKATDSLHRRVDVALLSIGLMNYSRARYDSLTVNSVLVLVSDHMPTRTTFTDAFLLTQSVKLNLMLERTKMSYVAAYKYRCITRNSVY